MQDTKSLQRNTIYTDVGVGGFYCEAVGGH